LRAQGNELSNEIRSAADKQRVIILADAYKTSQQIRGEGDAKAAAIYASAFSKDSEFYEFTRSMRAYDATFNNKSDILVIDPKSDFFKYLNKSKGTN
jgi:membrane protease subunit HflC